MNKRYLWVVEFYNYEKSMWVSSSGNVSRQQARNEAAFIKSHGATTRIRKYVPEDK